MTHITNYDVAWDAARYIIDHPDEHGQGRWVSACGTFRCFAGWVAYLTGWRNDVDPVTGEHYDDVSKNGVRGSTPRAACHELGMPYIGAEFWRLFDSGHTLYDILSALTEFAGEDGVTVPDDILAARAVARAADQEAEVMDG